MVMKTIGAAVVSWLCATWILPVLPAFLAHTHQKSPPACEGYWPDADTCLDLGPSRPSIFRLTGANAACPQWRINPDGDWAGREDLSSKIRDIQSNAEEWEKALADAGRERIELCAGCEKKPPRVWVRRERGLAWSRIQEGIIAGNSEFRSEDDTLSVGGREGGRAVCWTDALLPMYIDKFRVEPSDGFKEFVAVFDLDSFRGQLAKLKRCMAG